MLETVLKVRKYVAKLWNEMLIWMSKILFYKCALYLSM